MEAPKGLTLPSDGVGGDWIVKLPSPRFEPLRGLPRPIRTALISHIDAVPL
jgi:hypothetical protein